jgi:hypothetical protein
MTTSLGDALEASSSSTSIEASLTAASRAERLLIAALVLFLGACAAIQNTPQQDLAYARWAKCNAPYVQLDRVDVDGQITFRFSNEGSRQETLRCLEEAGRTGPPLPTPVGVPPPSVV